MKSLLDFVMTMLDDFKEKEYISSRDIVNHKSEAEFHKGKQEAYKEVISYLQFTLNSNKLSKMEAIQKEIYELFKLLQPMAEKFTAATLKRFVKEEDSMIQITLKRYDGEELYDAGTTRKDSPIKQLNIDFTFDAVAKLLVKEAADTQTGSVKVVVEHKHGFFTMDMSEMLELNYETDELPF